LLCAVLDTNVLISGLCRYEGAASYRIVQSMGVEWALALTPAIFLEYEAVLSRENIRSLTRLSRAEVKHVLDYVAHVAEQSTTYYTWRPNLRDESDNMFVDCAVVARADYIITGNKRHFTVAELGPFEFEVVTPAEFARSLS